MRYIYLISFVLTAFFVSAQDTISVLSYNVLNYTSTNANKARYADLRVILNYLKPDVVLLSEIVENSGAQLLLDSAFNKAGAGNYARSVFIDGFDTDNSLFYKTSKINLKSQSQIKTSIRDISQYKIYYISSPGDTAWVYLHSAHLKAGSAQADMDQRNSEVKAFCSSISSISQNSNILISGDFNMRGNDDLAWGTLTSTNCSHIFNDPINQGGYWYSNQQYKNIHTQSSRSSDNPGCCGGATGGMDDRFDFILTNNPLTIGANKLQVIPSSYKSIGNDGNHFNLSLNVSPTNTVYPPNIVQAVFNMSDHLPVFCKFKVLPKVNNSQNLKKNIPFSLHISRDADGFKPFAIVEEDGNYTSIVYNLMGAKIMESEIFLKKGKNDLQPFLNITSNGMYLIVLKNKAHYTYCKIPIQNY